MYELYLAHHGIKGMKWGVRRYQNPDGTLTKAGKRRQLKRNDTDIRKAKIALGVAEKSSSAAEEQSNRSLKKLKAKKIRSTNLNRLFLKKIDGAYRITLKPDDLSVIRDS